MNGEIDTSKALLTDLEVTWLNYGGLSTDNPEYIATSSRGQDVDFGWVFDFVSCGYIHIVSTHWVSVHWIVFHLKEGYVPFSLLPYCAIVVVSLDG